jgi:hypothetical protein
MTGGPRPKYDEGCGVPLTLRESGSREVSTSSGVALKHADRAQDEATKAGWIERYEEWTRIAEEPNGATKVRVDPAEFLRMQKKAGRISLLIVIVAVGVTVAWVTVIGYGMLGGAGLDRERHSRRSGLRPRPGDTVGWCYFSEL